MKILVTGKTGQLGTALWSLAPKELADFVFSGREEMDLLDARSIEAHLNHVNPDWILNAAAYTQVDAAEEQRELAYRVNAEAPGVMARWCSENGRKLIHYSTDYVFDGGGSSFWKEEDASRPLNAYGWSKHEGEKAIMCWAPWHVVFRTSWVYSAHGKNFLLTMLRLAKERKEIQVVNDQWGAPTTADFLAAKTFEVIRRVLAWNPAESPCGVYHLVPKGETTWFGFARKIYDEAYARHIIDRKPEVLPIDSVTFASKARRPSNSRLDTAKVQRDFGLTLESWETGLAQVMDRIELAGRG